MQIAPNPNNEEERLEALYRLEILDTKPDPQMDRITNIVRTMFDVPIVLISFVDTNRQWFKSTVGTSLKETPRDQAFCSHAILEKQVMVIPDAKADPRFNDNPLVTGKPFIRFYAGAPLILSSGEALGTLCIIDQRPRTLREDQVESLTQWSKMVVHELELRRAAAQDALTGALNRRYFDEAAEAEMSRSVRHKMPLSMVVLDLDLFKQVNDNYGHTAGDIVLGAFGARVSELIRASDIFARMGGEEFALLLPQTDIYGGKAMADRVLDRLSSEPVSIGHEEISVTVSAGVTAFTGEQDTLRNMLDRADEALYLAKENGRNRTEILAAGEGSRKSIASGG